MSTNMTDIRSVPLAALQLSSTPAQIERRAHLDKAKLTELAASIKSHGLVQPILVRPAPIIRSQGLNGATVAGKTYFGQDQIEEAARTHFEVVAGERRVLAARQAGLEEIAATIRELTDEQVLELQLIENLQRQDLHELAEAEGYEALQKLGHSIDDMAAKVGKSKATVYARMKLLELSKPARKAFYEGRLNASTALLVARIHGEEFQKEALKAITEGRWSGAGPMSYRDAAKYVHDTFMLRLSDAGFPTQDADLVAGAGTCGACPKRTGNQPELFEDVKGVDVCTDPTCFRAKRDANAARIIEKAQASGQTVITGKEAKKIAPRGVDSSLNDYVRPTERIYQDPKNRTAKQILGKAAEGVLLQDPETGKVVEIFKESKVQAALKEQGVRPTSSNSQQTARDKKAKAERAFRSELYKAIRPRMPEKLGRIELEQIARVFFFRLENEIQKTVVKMWSWEPVTKKSHGYTHTSFVDTADAHLSNLTDPELSAFLLDCSFAMELRAPTWSDSKPERLLEAAKRFKIDPEKIRKELAAAEKAKSPAPAKALKKKAGKKAA